MKMAWRVILVCKLFFEAVVAHRTASECKRNCYWFDSHWRIKIYFHLYFHRFGGQSAALSSAKLKNVIL